MHGGQAHIARRAGPHCTEGRPTWDHEEEAHEDEQHVHGGAGRAAHGQRVAQVPPQQLVRLRSRAGEPAGGVVVVQRLGGHGVVAAGSLGGGKAAGREGSEGEATYAVSL